MKLSEALLKLNEGFVDVDSIRTYFGTFGKQVAWEPLLCWNQKDSVDLFRKTMEQSKTHHDVQKNFMKLAKDKKIRFNGDPETIRMVQRSNELELTWMDKQTKKQVWVTFKKS